MDAETYLRCRLEDALIGRDRGPSDLRYRVRAALAIGAIDEATADAVHDGAVRAFRLRSEDADDWVPDQERPAPRIVVRPTLITQDWGTAVISHVVLGPHETVLGVQGELAPSYRRRREHHDLPWESLEVVDGAGMKHDTHFSGGSSDDTFQGEYHVHPALDVDSTTVTIGGSVVDLGGASEAPVMRVGTTAASLPVERARRHLELLSGSVRHRETSEREIAAETFADLGLDVAPRADDPRPGPARGTRGRQPKQDAQPKRWVAVGAVLPALDGVGLTLSALSDDGTLEFLGTTSGRVMGPNGWPPVRFSAVDDLGRRYTGEIRGSGWGGGSFHGRVNLTPTIDDDATTLTIGVDLLRHHVEIDVPIVWVQA